MSGSPESEEFPMFQNHTTPRKKFPTDINTYQNSNLNTSFENKNSENVSSSDEEDNLGADCFKFAKVK